jgi:hypothetical protein
MTVQRERRSRTSAQWIAVLSMLSAVACGTDDNARSSGAGQRPTIVAMAGTPGLSGTSGATSGDTTQRTTYVTSTPEECGNTAGSSDGSGCPLGLQCTEPIPSIRACTCPNRISASVSTPPFCDPTVTNSCAAFPGTTCQNMFPLQLAASAPNGGNYCVPTSGSSCTPRAAPGGTAGAAAESASMSADPACGYDSSRPADAAGCMGGMICSNFGVGSACVCATNKLPPSCSAGAAGSCAAYPGTVCQTVNGTSVCLKSCQIPGAPIVNCPNGFTCIDLPLAGRACVQTGQPLPPSCTPGDPPSCGALPGSICLDSGGFGAFCVKMCTGA